MVLQVPEKASIDKQLVQITRIEFKIENGVSSTQNVEYANIRTHSGKVKDLKFVDDEKLMLAISGKSKRPQKPRSLSYEIDNCSFILSFEYLLPQANSLTRGLAL